MEMHAIRIDEAATGTTSAPTLATDGIAVPDSYGRKYSRLATQIVTNGGTTPVLTTALGLGGEGGADDLHLLCVKSAASGTRTFRVKVFGYLSQLIDKTAGTPVASSNKWYELFDTEEHSNAADFNKAFRLQI